jgi:hypothetical protein
MRLVWLSLSALVASAPALPPERPTIEIVLSGRSAADAALLVRVRNGTRHRPLGLLREFWKFESIRCELSKDGVRVPPAMAVRPDRPTLAQLVVLEPLAEYGERLALAGAWRADALGAGSYRATCRPSRRVEPSALREASMRSPTRSASAALTQDLARVDTSLADVEPTTLEFSLSP